MPAKGTKCSKCGYVLRKYAVQCPKCRTSLMPKESAVDLARRYLRLIEAE